MILVQNFLRLRDVNVLGTGRLVPRKRGHPFQIGACNHVFRGSRCHLREALQLALAFLLGLSGHSRLFHFLAKLFDLGLPIIGFAELFLNRLHLFAKQELALRLIHLFLNLLVNLVAQLEHFALFRQLIDQSLQPLLDAERFEQLLPNHGAERRQSKSDEIRQAPG